MRMLYECIAAHVLWIIWDAECDGDIRFWIKPEERPILKFKILFHPYLPCPILCQDSKNIIYFDARLLEMPIIRFKK